MVRCDNESDQSRPRIFLFPIFEKPYLERNFVYCDWWSFLTVPYLIILSSLVVIFRMGISFRHMYVYQHIFLFKTTQREGKNVYVHVRVYLHWGTRTKYHLFAPDTLLHLALTIKSRWLQHIPRLANWYTSVFYRVNNH